MKGDNRPIWILGIVALLCCMTCGGLTYLAYQLMRTAAAVEELKMCEDQIAKIGIALESYQTEYSEYPPACVVDAQGKPQHSWRVLILPYLGKAEEELYKEYHFDEPWNGPRNKRLVELMPQVFACPYDPVALVKGHTSYLILEDPATRGIAAWPRPAGKGLAKLAPTNVVLIEVVESGIAWLEPRDLALKPAQAEIDADATDANAATLKNREMFSYHPNGCPAYLEDGTKATYSDQQVRDILAGRASDESSQSSAAD